MSDVGLSHFWPPFLLAVSTSKLVNQTIPPHSGSLDPFDVHDLLYYCMLTTSCSHTCDVSSLTDVPPQKTWFDKSNPEWVSPPIFPTGFLWFSLSKKSSLTNLAMSLQLLSFSWCPNFSAYRPGFHCSALANLHSLLLCLFVIFDWQNPKSS